MTYKILLKVAAGCMMFHALGHTLGHFTWKNKADPVMQEVIRAMEIHKFAMMESQRSIGENYHGMSAIMIVVLLLFAVILWNLASTSPSKKTAVQILLPFAVGLVAISLLEFRFFFALAAGSSLAAGALTVIATAKMMSVSKSVSGSEA